MIYPEKSKISSNKYTFAWKKAVGMNYEKLNKKTENIFTAIAERYGFNGFSAIEEC